MICRRRQRSTIEDIAEALLGDILEEHEHPEPLVRREPSGAFLVRGDTPVAEVERILGLKLAAGAEVTATSKRRIREVRIRRRSDAGERHA